MSSEQTEPSVRRRPWWVWLIGGLLLLFGAVLVILGGQISGLSDYQRSIFAHIGTAIGLIGPLFVAERLLSIRVLEAKDEATAARSAAGEALKAAKLVRTVVTDLDQEVRDQLAQIRGEDEQRQQSAAEGKFQDFVDLYNHASAHRRIDRRGLRVPTGMGDLWLLVRVVKRAPDGESKWFVELVFEGAKLEPIGQSVVWSGDEPVADMFVRLASTLKQTRSWPGDDAFRPGKLLHDVASDLGKIVDLHTGPHGDHQVSMIIEVVGDDWAVTREGLDSLHATDLHVDSGELVGDAKNGAFQRLGQHVLAEGLDEASFRSSFRNAKQVHAALRAESREKFAKFGREI